MVLEWSLLGEDILFLPLEHSTGPGTPVHNGPVLHVPVLSENNANVFWQGQDIAADYKLPALKAQMNIAPLLRSHL